MVPTAWVHPLLTSGRCLVVKATQWLSPISFQEQVFLREQDDPSDIYKWAHRSGDNLAASSANSTHLHAQEHIHLPCMGNQLGTVFQGSLTPRRGEERDVHVSQNLYDKWWVTTTKESTAAPTDSCPLCSSSQYRHLQSGREKGQGHSYLKQRCSPSSDATGEQLPYSRHQLSISVSCSLSFPANSYFSETTLLKRAWWEGDGCDLGSCGLRGLGSDMPSYTNLAEPASRWTSSSVELTKTGWYEKFSWLKKREAHDLSSVRD